MYTNMRIFKYVDRRPAVMAAQSIFLHTYTFFLFISFHSALQQHTNEFASFFSWSQVHIIYSFIFKLVLSGLDWSCKAWNTPCSHFKNDWKQKPNQPSSKTNMKTRKARERERRGKEIWKCRACNYIHIRCLLLSFFPSSLLICRWSPCAQHPIYIYTSYKTVVHTCFSICSKYKINPKNHDSN